MKRIATILFLLIAACVLQVHSATAVETFKELKEIRPDVKVLLCSGFGREQYFQELFDSGAAGFLQKPFRHTEFLQKIEEVTVP